MRVVNLQFVSLVVSVSYAELWDSNSPCWSFLLAEGPVTSCHIHQPKQFTPKLSEQVTTSSTDFSSLQLNRSQPHFWSVPRRRRDCRKHKPSARASVGHNLLVRWEVITVSDRVIVWQTTGSTLGSSDSHHFTPASNDLKSQGSHKITNYSKASRVYLRLKTWQSSVLRWHLLLRNQKITLLSFGTNLTLNFCVPWCQVVMIFICSMSTSTIALSTQKSMFLAH